MNYIPKYRINFETNKHHDFAVVVPVLNEGERIANFLLRMYALNIHNIADIIIIDGGSTDNSIEPIHINSIGVNSLLTKIDSGKLSVQLLCAYDFCNQRKYNGIITIDGNNKDDPKDIPTFINMLKNGYDFIQASRFVCGGHAKNTPLTRYLAIRLIHAPILSILSGFHWTDTTQGFRGYSKNMLFSEKINIFRSIFQGYELLAYLSYAGPKFGFKCVEVGTSRVYPKGKIPTKITSFYGNFSLLKILWNVFRGHYNP